VSLNTISEGGGGSQGGLTKNGGGKRGGGFKIVIRLSMFPEEKPRGDKSTGKR